MKKLVRYALPLLAAGLLAACGDDTQAQFDRAKAAYAAGDFNAARIDLTMALRDDPKNLDMLKWLLRTQLRMNDPQGAEFTLRKLEALGWKDAEYKRAKAETSLLKGEPDAALALLGNDATSDGWRIRAAALLRNDDALGAIQAWEKGMAAGKDMRVAIDYARYRLSTNDVDGAAAIYARMKEWAPGEFETMTMAGDLANARGDVNGAIAAWKAASDKFPKRFEPILAVANKLESQGKVKEALAYAERAAKLKPNDADVRNLRTMLYAVTGEWEKVRTILEPDQANFEPGSSEALRYAEAMLRLGKPEVARSIFSRAVLVLPSNPYARLMLAEAQMETGDAVNAYATIKPLVASPLARQPELELAEKAARESGNPDADALRARLKSTSLAQLQALGKQGQDALTAQNWGAAVTAYEALRAQGGDDAEVLKRLAFAYSKAGRGSDAIAAADAALAQRPENVDYIHLAGLVRLNAGTDMSNAITLLSKAAKIDPYNPVLKGDLARAQAAL